MTTRSDRQLARLARIPVLVLAAVAAACGTTPATPPVNHDAQAPVGFDAGPIVVSGDAEPPTDATAPPSDAGTDAATDAAFAADSGFDGGLVNAMTDATTSADGGDAMTDASASVDGSDATANGTDASTVTALDSSVPSDATPAPDAASCSATADEVVMIGDSYLALSGQITVQLQSLATVGGALAAGASYRHYYRSGANMYTYADSAVTPIPAQFTQAVAASADIKYVIMDGIGNDILIENPACIDAEDAAAPSSGACAAVVENAVATEAALFETMQAAGVEKVIYFFYPHLPTTLRPDVNVMIDYAYARASVACAASPIPCYFIDTRPAFEGHPEYIGPDDIHPTTAGSNVIAGLIWGVMQQECVAF